MFDEYSIECNGINITRVVGIFVILFFVNFECPQNASFFNDKKYLNSTNISKFIYFSSLFRKETSFLCVLTWNIPNQHINIY